MPCWRPRRAPLSRYCSSIVYRMSWRKRYGLIQIGECSSCLIESRSVSVGKVLDCRPGNPHWILSRVLGHFGVSWVIHFHHSLSFPSDSPMYQSYTTSTLIARQAAGSLCVNQSSFLTYDVSWNFIRIAYY